MLSLHLEDECTRGGHAQGMLQKSATGEGGKPRSYPEYIRGFGTRRVRYFYKNTRAK